MADSFQETFDKAKTLLDTTLLNKIKSYRNSTITNAYTFITRDYWLLIMIISDCSESEWFHGKKDWTTLTLTVAPRCQSTPGLYILVYDWTIKQTVYFHSVWHGSIKTRWCTRFVNSWGGLVVLCLWELFFTKRNVFSPVSLSISFQRGIDWFTVNLVHILNFIYKDETQ